MENYYLELLLNEVIFNFYYLSWFKMWIFATCFRSAIANFHPRSEFAGRLNRIRPSNINDKFEYADVAYVSDFAISTKIILNTLVSQMGKIVTIWQRKISFFFGFFWSCSCQNWFRNLKIKTFSILPYLFDNFKLLPYPVLILTLDWHRPLTAGSCGQVHCLVNGLKTKFRGWHDLRNALPSQHSTNLWQSGSYALGPRRIIQ